MTREDYITACQTLDPNGEYSDVQARASGDDPMTLEEARAAFNRLALESFTNGVFGR